MPSLYERLRADIVTAMKARDSKTALILRTLDAAVQRASMDLGKPIDDGLVTTTLRKSVKNLADARAEFEKGGRMDLVENNSAEITVLERYLPKGLEPAQVEALVAEAIRTTGATTKKEMGKVIAALKQHPDAGSLDFGSVSKVVQSRLA
ncbi:MAG: GatB/YqeY domain-containing protein [Opitutaceae bacterium]